MAVDAEDAHVGDIWLGDMLATVFSSILGIIILSGEMRSEEARRACHGLLVAAWLAKNGFEGWRCSGEDAGGRAPAAARPEVHGTECVRRSGETLADDCWSREAPGGTDTGG